MKLFTLVTMLFFSLSLSAQSFKKSISANDSTKLSITDSVFIKDGHDQLVKVHVTGVFPATVWNEFVKSKGIDDKAAFDFVINMLALKAKYSLKISDSFQPLPSQFLIWYEKDKSFISKFRMMGRNGYGNLTETSELVKYDPQTK